MRSSAIPLHILAAVAAALVASACDLPWSSAPRSGPLPKASALAPTVSSSPVSADWPTYHRDAARSGALPGGPQTSTRPSSRAYPPVDGDVYASPVIAGGLVVVATENDTVYAFDPAAGRLRWSRHLGTPVQASSLPCGDIGPETGITGTPVVDPVSGTLFVVDYEQPAHHVLYALDLRQGTPRGMTAVDPPGETPTTEQQRGALALANGDVYVPFGGLFGDCGQYHGWVVGVPVGGGAAVTYRVPCDRECGIWAPAGPVVDGTGDLWVATGNGEPFDRYTYANSVLKLRPDLQLADSFAPSDWSSLSQQDQDLGSISPVLLDAGLVWISGKAGRGYLLRQDHLGRIGGQAFQGQACSSFSGALWVAPLVVVACTDQLLAVRVDASRPSFSTAWSAKLDAPGSPILAYGALWVVETGTGRLHALDPASGRDVVPPIPGGQAMHFVTPAAGGGDVYAVLNRRLVAVMAAAG